AAKDKDMAIGDIIIDAANINDIQFREYINPVLATEIEIPCDGCEFQEHEAILCLNLNKLNVSIELGENFNMTEENCGIPVFFNSSYIEEAWKSDFSGGDTLDNLFILMQKF
ncbi:28734_t:CDS:2, partial [Dentiscutata erythropus]